MRIPEPARALPDLGPECYAAWRASGIDASAAMIDAAKARARRQHAEQAGFAVEEVRGAVYYPRWPLAARILCRHDARLSRLTTFGAGFVALAAVKHGRH